MIILLFSTTPNQPHLTFCKLNKQKSFNLPCLISPGSTLPSNTLQVSSISLRLFQVSAFAFGNRLALLVKLANAGGKSGSEYFFFPRSSQCLLKSKSSSFKIKSSMSASSNKLNLTLFLEEPLVCDFPSSKLGEKRYFLRVKDQKVNISIYLASTFKELLFFLSSGGQFVSSSNS